MEHSSVALFQILYQHETLFQLEDRTIPARPAVEEVAEPEPVPTPATVQADVPTLPATPAVPASALPATPDIAPAAAEVPASRPPAPAVTLNPAIAAPGSTAPAFPALAHKVLVLVEEPKQQDMIMSEAIFLDNILKAVGHSLETSDVLNVSFMPGKDARTVLSGKKTNFFISFGVPLIRLQLDMLLAPYTPKMVEGIWFLLVDPLVVIEADRNLKKKLWQALQQMFQTS